MKLAHKLTFGLCGGVLVVHAVATSYRIYRENRLFEADVGRDARVLGRALAYAAERAWETGGEAEVHSLTAYTTGRKPHTTVRLVWPERKTGPGAPVLDLSSVGGLVGGEPITLLRDTPAEELLTYVPVEFRGGLRGALELTDPLRFERGYFRQSLITAVATMFATVAACVAIAWLLVSRLVRDHIRLLVSQARGVGEGDLGQRVPVSNDELGLLAIEMNRMCEHLQEASLRADTEAAARAIAMAQLRHADRLATIGTLASSVAHELGTPINVIKGYARLITESGVSPIVEENVSVVEAQCERMATIIRQWLTFAQRGRERDETCFVPPVIAETLKMVAPIARASQVIVTQGPALEAYAAIGARALQQVLLNLSVNAIQSMPNGGELRLTMHELPAAAESPARLCISVSDTGSGIDPEIASHVFEPFLTTKPPTEGTGLGLPIATGIAADYGGGIELASSSPTGTTFNVYLLKSHS